MPSKLQQYFGLLQEKLFNHLQDFSLTGKEASLHDFRVEIKKLKAIIKFLKIVHKKQPFKKISHSIDTIFKEAGMIREHQLMQQWLATHQLPNIAKIYFPATELKTKIASFQQLTGSYQRKLLRVTDSCQQSIRKKDKVSVVQYCKELEAEIEHLLQQPLAVNDWHRLRIRIKQWLYTLNWIDWQEKKRSPMFLLYNKLQESIGSWHDLQVLKETLYQKNANQRPNRISEIEFATALKKVVHAIRYRERKIAQLLASILVRA